MVRCRLCLIPNSRPDTAFVDGVCSACTNFAQRATIDWTERKVRLETILETGRNGSGFDCIVPSSGGKDSTFQVMTLLAMGAKPLVVTASTCMLTEIGRANIDNLARYATTIEVTPNCTVRAKLNRLGLELVGDISYPEHMAIFSVPFQVAVAYGIPLIFYGENPQEAYSGPPGTELAEQLTARWRSEFGGFLGLRPSDCVGQYGITERDMLDYALPASGIDRVRAYFIGQFVGPWDSHKNAEAAKTVGFSSDLPTRANWWTFENVDNAMTGIHDFFSWLKYGYGRAAAQLSVDIRNGRIWRADALACASEREGLFPSYYMGVYIDSILDRIGIDRSTFLDICNRFMDKGLFVEDHIDWDRQLTLKGETWGADLQGEPDAV